MSRRLTRRAALAGTAVLPAVTFLPHGVCAQPDWRPTQGVRIVVPAAPGGTTDIAGRLLAAYLQQTWGQSCVVDNKSGAGGIIGSTEVVKSTPDGLTALMGNIGPQSIAYSLYRNLPYTPASLIPVSNAITAPNVLVVHPSVPAKTVPEFVAWLKAQNGKVSYASSGTGQSPHLSAAWFLQLTGTKAEHVPYRGAAPALNDLIAGVTQFFFDNLTSSIEFMRAGKLRALGLTSAQPNPLTPDVPPIASTMPELKTFDVSTWFGVFLPAKTPRPIVDAYNAGMKAWLSDPKTLERIKTMAGFPAYGTPEEFDTFVTRQIALWKGVIDKEGLKMDVN
ncbi:MAG: tripartite tricarboxylate transporter substrate binding protein [Enhydrobacter sp.]|nr:tripartite tricarboxylate transporter substrate binding protein [Enhydrobacter sp.]